MSHLGILVSKRSPPQIHLKTTCLPVATWLTAFILHPGALQRLVNVAWQKIVGIKDNHQDTIRARNLNIYQFLVKKTTAQEAFLIIHGPKWRRVQ